MWPTPLAEAASVYCLAELDHGALRVGVSSTDPTLPGTVPSLLPAGSKIAGGRYTVVRVLGAGGMGTVYLCEQAQPQREVVIKFPHPTLMSQAGFRERFEAEIQFMISLDHPGVASIYETGDHEGLPFAVLQYLTGGSLGDRLESKATPQTVQQIDPWLGPVAATLDSIHEDGVLHRDVKPDNILFDRRGHVFRSDFGISKAIAEISSPSMALTRTGMFVGSPRYAPPEYIDRRFSPACDQYSLAAVVYFAATGRPPHEAETTERFPSTPTIDSGTAGSSPRPSVEVSRARRAMCPSIEP